MFFAVKGNSDMIRIAVCDDDWTIREELSRLIKEQAPKADIVEYKSGEEMVNDKENFAISFLDIEMGRVSGLDVARRIREGEDRSCQRSIIIFITGYREYMEGWIPTRQIISCNILHQQKKSHCAAMPQ